ncbi:MAG: hypothetical protein QM667_01970 [Asticcacaulis sp.]
MIFILICLCPVIALLMRAAGPDFYLATKNTKSTNAIVWNTCVRRAFIQLTDLASFRTLRAVFWRKDFFRAFGVFRGQNFSLAGHRDNR